MANSEETAFKRLQTAVVLARAGGCGPQGAAAGSPVHPAIYSCEEGKKKKKKKVVTLGASLLSMHSSTGQMSPMSCFTSVLVCQGETPSRKHTAEKRGGSQRESISARSFHK